ncbi:HD domain-containing protein [Roseomonas nepalensis]|uniref:HD domain-containing protein n=1 Tax=Muricoccus nepalensis TaxID=1854500 RepID=A0A502G5P2_9PROT|nr:HD domain-containing protein [Roseomonas nepalensis]
MLGLLRELGELKRIRSAGRAGSIADRLFSAAWSALGEGRSPEECWRATTAAALVATRMGDIDRGVLASLGIDGDAAEAILGRALEEAAEEVDPALLPALRDAAPAEATGPVPPFVALLAQQPRAGVTCPGRPRLLLEPPENHAEHCLMVAVYGVLLSPLYGARPEVVYLASLAHHLHNAMIPDSGFAGEVLLGNHLEPAFARATEAALAELPPPLAERVRAARAILPDAETPEGRAFHAADTLDRVLQIEQHLRAGKASMSYVLNDMALVHEGPVKPFQDRLLAAVGLAA